MVPSLFVIEAPGKARSLDAILARIGFAGSRVQATRGHILAMPRTLSPIGIDSALHEFARQPIDLAVVQRLRDEAAAARQVFIATDADHEGDVIACDVADLIRDLHPAPLRVRLRGMDDESVRDALAEARPLRRLDAVPGRTRAIIDRLIGATCSQGGVAVGRVGTALLGLVASGKVTPYRLRLSAPAKDGGRPWLAECDVLAPLSLEVARRLAALSLPVLDVAASRAAVAPPGHMGDVLVRGAERFDVEPQAVAQAMQGAYEAGRLSYPRSGARGMSRAAARKMRRILEQAGARFDEALVADKPQTAPHDAPYPIGPVNLAFEPARLGLDEGIRLMVAKDLVASGQARSTQTALTAGLEQFLVAAGFPAAVGRHIAGLEWRRDLGPRYPGQESWRASGLVQRRADAALLDAAIAAGLGTPSTWASHIQRFMDRGLVDDALALTDKGRHWVAASPPALLDPRLAAALERAFERTDIIPAAILARADTVATAPGDLEPWQALARRIIAVMPEPVRVRVLEAIRHEPPRPARDIRAMLEPGLDIAGMVADAAGAAAAAYRPDEF